MEDNKVTVNEMDLNKPKSKNAQQMASLLKKSKTKKDFKEAPAVNQEEGAIQETSAPTETAETQKTEPPIPAETTAPVEPPIPAETETPELPIQLEETTPPIIDPTYAIVNLGSFASEVGFNLAELAVAVKQLDSDFCRNQCAVHRCEDIVLLGIGFTRQCPIYVLACGKSLTAVSFELLDMSSKIVLDGETVKLKENGTYVTHLSRLAQN